MGVPSRFLPLLTLIAASFLSASSVCAGSMPPATTAHGVPKDIRAIFGKPQYSHSAWALRVLDGSKPVIDLDSKKLLYIGSVRKVFSVGELLNAVGPAHTFDTPVYRTGSLSRDGVLRGNLILVASGDLTMGGRTNPDGTIAISNWDHNEANTLGNAILTTPDPLAGYAELSRAVRASGITRVTGNIVVDDRLFEPFAFRDEFDVRPIFVNDDVVDVSIHPGETPGTTARLAPRPQSDALRINNAVRVGPAGSDASVDIAPELPSCIGTTGCTSTASGSIPVHYVQPLSGEPALVRTIRIVAPANYARTVFIEKLRAAGVAVDAAAVAQNPIRLLPPRDSYAAPMRVAQLMGLPYAQDAKLVLKVSYNIGADTSLVLLGVQHGARSMKSALAFERTALQSRWGIAPSEYHFVDGSGGGETTATASAVTKMLDELAHSPASEAFEAALPILGVDGSLAFVKDFEHEPTLAGAAGNVHAKTGTYVGPAPSGGVELKAQALAGYITTKRGHRLTFQLAVNHVPMKTLSDVTNVFQDQGAIVAMLWRDY